MSHPPIENRRLIAVGSRRPIRVVRHRKLIAVEVDSLRLTQLDRRKRTEIDSRWQIQADHRKLIQSDNRKRAQLGCCNSIEIDNRGLGQIGFDKMSLADFDRLVRVDDDRRPIQLASPGIGLLARRTSARPVELPLPCLGSIDADSVGRLLEQVKPVMACRLMERRLAVDRKAVCLD